MILGIPTIRDRIVQQACKIVIEPVFEANFLDSSYGFRPKRDAKQATEKVKKELYKNWYVVDADIQGYFDNINHEILLGLLNRPSVIEGSLSYADSGYKQESLKMGNIIQRKKVHRKEESLVRC